MANSASEMVSNAGETAREAGSGIVDTIMRNPVPAAMVGIGLGWLAMSGRSSSKSRSWSGDGGRWAASGQTRFGAGYGGDYGTDYGSSRSGSGGYDTRADQAAGDPMRRVKDRASEMADQAGETVEQVKDQVGRMADEVPYRVQGTARDVGDQVGRMYDDNPLAMGAIAVAVGAAVGLALPATQMERRTIGQPARQMLEKAEETASDALGQVEQKAQDAEQQAREQDEQAKGQESRARAH